MEQSQDPTTGTTIDAREVERFTQMAQEWWDPMGKFRPLHKFNPVRLKYLRDQLCAHFNRDPNDDKPLAGLRILDIGCGGGLLCEPLARLGAEMVGADPGVTNIEVARLHSAQSGLDIDYRAHTSEELEAAGENFDVVLAMEVVEHVADVDLFLTSCGKMVRPGGLMFVATINRTMKAWGLAIIGAEYVLGWLPRGTHQYDKLVKPQEIENALQNSGLTFFARSGVSYNPLRDQWVLSKDMDVNFMMVASRSNEAV